jgi:pyrroline-5-carboxylate reductase
MKFGFVGTGAITEAMVTGFLGSKLELSQVIVSPRSAETAARLAAHLSLVQIANDNQAVVDASDVLFLAVRPQVAEEVIKALRFRQGQAIVSVIAATDRSTIGSWIDQDVELTLAIPLPFVADGEGVTAIYPPSSRIASIFSATGGTIQCETKEEYDLLAVASSLMGTYFGILDSTTEWLISKGMPASKAREYIAPLFASLAQTALNSDQATFDEIRREFSTKGGLNEQVFEDFDRKGGTRALTDALDRVYRRIQG